MSEKNGFQHLCFGDDIGASLHHHNTRFRAGHNDIEITIFPFADCRVDHQLSIDTTHPDAADGTRKGNI